MSMIYKLADDFDDKSLLGNKGANLVTMTKLGLPVPPGFVVSIEAYREYKHNGKLPMEEIERYISIMASCQWKKSSGLCSPWSRKRGRAWVKG